jgi:hypothetical protein
MLFYGADFIVKGGSQLASRFGLSPIVIGLTVVAFGTSLPELVVSIVAAIEGSSPIAIFDPTTFPIEIGDDPSIAATILTTNSGKEVPNATTVRPITIGDKPKRLASWLPPFTIKSAP